MKPIRTRLRRTFLLSLTAAALLAACGAPRAPTTAASAQPAPKLLVFFVVDGLPQRQVLQYRDQLAADGFARFLDRGAWYANAHYAHAFTVTAAGHATMLTGAYPHRTGIIGNEWRDQHTGMEVYNTGDPDAKYIGHDTKPLDGTSPKNLKVEALGDVLKKLNPASKVVAISGKDRGAILPGGKTGTAYMYQSSDGQFASSSYYMQDHPAWVKAWNGRKLADRYFKAEWKPLLPDAAYARSLPDAQPWYNGPPRLPMLMAGAANDDKPTPAFYGSLLRSPYGDALALEFARAAIAGEELGRDDAPDILSVSLSGHDYVNHAYSAESRMSHDHFLQLDRLLEAFFRDLDASVGRDNYVAVLTADHGFMPAPEFSKAQGRDSGRIDYRAVQERINAGLAQKFGEGKWMMGYSSASLLLDKKLIAARGVRLDDVAAAARDLLLKEQGFETAYTRAELLAGSRAGALYFDASRKAWHPDVSGEVQFSLKPYWMFASRSASTHGSPHEYDTHVPILMWGPQWVPAGRVEPRVEVVDLAPTLAQVLHVPAPPAAEGRLLPAAP